MSKSTTEERAIEFKITEHIGIITEYPTGWNKELNMVSWNGKMPKYDIRDWDENHERMSKGLTLHEKEMRALIGLVEKMVSF